MICIDSTKQGIRSSVAGYWFSCLCLHELGAYSPRLTGEVTAWTFAGIKLSNIEIDIRTSHPRDIERERIDPPSAQTIYATACALPSTLPSISYPTAEDYSTYHPLRARLLNLKPTAAMSTAPTAKLQPTQSKEPDPAQTSQTAAPATSAPQLEEDDEFEDFPVEGTSLSPPCPSSTLRFSWLVRLARLSSATLGVDTV